MTINLDIETLHRKCSTHERNRRVDAALQTISTCCVHVLWDTAALYGMVRLRAFLEARCTFEYRTLKSSKYSQHSTTAVPVCLVVERKDIHDVKGRKRIRTSINNRTHEYVHHY